VIGGVPKRIPNFIDGAGDTAFEVDVGVVAPDLLLQFLPGYNLAGPGEKGCQNTKGLPGKTDAQACFPNLSSVEVDLKSAKRNPCSAG
jgi:hypothetical protein